jgi:hypothetical protein
MRIEIILNDRWEEETKMYRKWKLELDIRGYLLSLLFLRLIQIDRYFLNFKASKFQIF